MTACLWIFGGVALALGWAVFLLIRPGNSTSNHSTFFLLLFLAVFAPLMGWLILPATNSIASGSEAVPAIFAAASIVLISCAAFLPRTRPPLAQFALHLAGSALAAAAAIAELFLRTHSGFMGANV